MDLFAQVVNKWVIEWWMIAVVVIAAGIALVTIGLKRFGVTIPDWFVQVIWVVVAAVVIACAIKIIFAMW